MIANDPDWQKLTPEQKRRALIYFRYLSYQERFQRYFYIPPDIAFMQGLLCFATLALVPMPPRSSPGVVIVTAYLLSLMVAIVLWRFLNPPARAEAKRWRTW